MTPTTLEKPTSTATPESEATAVIYLRVSSSVNSPVTTQRQRLSLA
jgi:hypothetical protein